MTNGILFSKNKYKSPGVPKPGKNEGIAPTNPDNMQTTSLFWKLRDPTDNYTYGIITELKKKEK